jgi:gluconolactonase
MTIRILEIAFLASTILGMACAKATPPTFGDGTGGEAGSASSSGTGGSPGVGGSGGTGGLGGSGGTGGPDVDPLAGIGPVEVIQGGFQAADGPVWSAVDGLLLFTDPPSNKIYSLTLPATVAVVRTPSGDASGLALDPAGLLVACERSGRRVSRTLSDQTVVDVATHWNSLPLNSPEDAVVGTDGSFYFTDPPFGLSSPGVSELAFFGIFWVDPIGMMTLIADDMATPNGIAFSPDKKTLYVIDTQTAEVRAFAMGGFGQVGMGMKLMNTSPGPDGMCVDEAGNLYIATSVGIEVYRKNGMLRGKIDVPELPTSCSFGDTDRKTLFITAGTSIYRVSMQVSGLP